MSFSENLYQRYCCFSNENNSKPIWYEDAFLDDSMPINGVSGIGEKLSWFKSARTTRESVSVHGAGNLTIIQGFASKLKNVSITIHKGDLTVFIGPYSDISNLSIQSLDDDSWLHFGAGNTINTGSVLVQGAGKSIFFGHDCMFSTNFHARTSDSHSIFSYENKNRINADKSIKIGDHSWIGRSVIFNKGVISEDDVVFGQGSVVSGKITGSSIYAGVPARKMKDGVTWDRTRSESMELIAETYVYRPQQEAINSFLKRDTPFHPFAKKIMNEIRGGFAFEKNYPWITE